jgi:hypothetical protein
VAAEAQRQRGRSAGSRRAAARHAAREEIKGRRGIVFSPLVEALEEERAAGKTATVKIDAGGQASTGGNGELDWAHEKRRGRLGSSV